MNEKEEERARFIGEAFKRSWPQGHPEKDKIMEFGDLVSRTTESWLLGAIKLSTAKILGRFFGGGDRGR